MNTVYIYGLYDPRNEELRYIGKAKDPNKRYIFHLTEGRHPKKFTYKVRWLSKILSMGLKPILKILEECSDVNWEEREIYWIEKEIKLGTRLTNISQGGQSGPSGERHPFYGGGEKITLEHRKNMGISARNKPPVRNETRIKMRESYLARIPPNKGRKLTKEWKQKVSESSKGKFKTNEHNKKNSLAVTMMWAKRQNKFDKIKLLQQEYFNLFGEYNQKYIGYI